MASLTPGKIRRLQTATSPRGIIKILAIDHRDVLLEMLDPENPYAIADNEVTDFKLDILRKAGGLASAVILDAKYCIGQAVATGSLPGNIGFLSALERELYDGTPQARETITMPGWGVTQIKRLGASGVKLVLYYHPDAGELTTRQERVAAEAIEACNREDIPMFLEPIAYSIDKNVPDNSPEFARQRRRIVLESVRRLGALKPDVLKVQFPIDGHFDTSESQWRAACEELNDLSPCPWALLSGGDPFEIFKAQLQVACEAGCSGFLAGRALWRELTTAEKSEREDLLQSIVLPRLEQLNEVAEQYGHPWQEKHTLPTIDHAWFATY